MKKIVFSIIVVLLIVGCSRALRFSAGAEKAGADDAIEGRENVLLSANETKAFIINAEGKTTPAPRLNDSDITGGALVVTEGLPAALLFDLPQAKMVSAFRLYSGHPGYRNNPSGVMSVTSYKVEGFSAAAGTWRELFTRENLPGLPDGMDSESDFFDMVSFDPLEVTRLRVTLLDSDDTGRRSDPNAKPPKSAIIREVELYAHERTANRRKQLNSVLQAELRLPVYRYQDTAHLYAILDDAVPELTVELSVK